MTHERSGDNLDEYLDLRRTLGFKLRDEGTVLPRFVSFLHENGTAVITADLALRWATQPEGVLPSHWTRRLTMARLFAQFRNAVDPRTEVPPQGLLPCRYQRKPPYIYNDGEILRLLEAAGRLKSRAGLRALTHSTVLGLISATGMRMQEPLALNREDVDLNRGVLTVRLTKFGKSRLIPVHTSTAAKLRDYERIRDQIVRKPKCPSFFLSERGTRLTQWCVRWTFVRLSHEIGLRGPNDSHGPRLHDFRHTFAVRTLLEWYRTGVDVERHMPKLATYLGHSHVSDTYWYISAVPELLRLAALRLDDIDPEALS